MASFGEADLGGVPGGLMEAVLRSSESIYGGEALASLRGVVGGGISGAGS